MGGAFVASVIAGVLRGVGYFVLLRLLVIMGWLSIAIGGLILSFLLMAMWVIGRQNVRGGFLVLQ